MGRREAESVRQERRDKSPRTRAGRWAADLQPFRRIMAAASSVDAIVRATGRTGFAHALIDCVAEKVVRLSPVPVLALRPAPGRAKRRR
jgi:nucleotide-binding universal stress UspA family protein